MKKLFAFIVIICITSAVQSQTGNVGIGTTSPKAKLHVADSNVVFAANGLALAVPGVAPVSGAGRRMMWYADKGAFRAGYASGNEWDNANVGKYSFATGYGATASTDFSAAIGLNVRATGSISMAFGNNAQATGDNALALGTVVFATKPGATAIGYGTFASAPFATAIGYNLVSKSFGGMVAGMYNDVNDNPFDTAAQTDRIFQLGNGYYDVNLDEETRTNAITVLRNGNTGIGTVLPANRLTVTGNQDITGRLGIGMSTPGFPLNFPSTVGDKISLYGSSGNHYGFGIQSGVMQIHTDLSSSNIVFGHGSSISFNERMRLVNNGTDGMLLRGRLSLLNGTSPVDVAQTPGLWIYRPDNAGQLSFWGAASNSLVGFYGGPQLWGLVYDATTSLTGIGIGATQPQYQLDLGGRMRIRHRGTEQAGIWLNNDLNSGTAAFVGLQNNNQVGFYGTGGIGWGLTMNTTTGAVSVGGNTGTDKQVMISNGAGFPPSWTTAGNIIQTLTSGETSNVVLSGTGYFDLTASTLTVTTSVPSRIIVFYRTTTWKTCIAGSCSSKWELTVLLNNSPARSYGIDGVRYAAQTNSLLNTDVTVGPDYFDVGAGTNVISFKARNMFNDPWVGLLATAMIIPR